MKQWRGEKKSGRAQGTILSNRNSTLIILYHCIVQSLIFCFVCAIRHWTLKSVRCYDVLQCIFSASLTLQFSLSLKLCNVNFLKTLPDGVFLWGYGYFLKKGAA